MIRALYTAASGMNAQQANIDNVAHNLANVNTPGFKKSHVQFEDLVYQETTAPGSVTPGSGESPTGLQTGLGTRAVASSSRGSLTSASSSKGSRGCWRLCSDGVFSSPCTPSRPRQA